MRRFLKIGLILGVSTALAWLALARTNTGSDNTALAETHLDILEDYQSVSHIKAAKLLGMDPSSYVLFDVRARAEYDVSHIDGSIWVDPELSAVDFYEAHKTTISGKQVVLYCSVGVRSSRLAERLYAFKPEDLTSKVFNLEMGVFGWHNQKHPLVKASDHNQISTDYIHPYNHWWGRMINRADLKKYNAE